MNKIVVKDHKGDLLIVDHTDDGYFLGNEELVKVENLCAWALLNRNGKVFTPMPLSDQVTQDLLAGNKATSKANAGP